MSSSAHGHFVWHDLITTDIPKAVDFYTKLVGWKTQAFDPEGKYQMWVGKNGPVGGVGAASPDSQPYWRPYIGTDDIVATAHEAQQLGGSVVSPITDISNGGKWAALRDPQGCEFGLYWAPDAKAPELKLQPGEFHWHELATDDYKSAFAFYQKLFGWQAGVEHDMGPMGMYSVFAHEGRPQGMGGMFNKPATMPRGGWCTYTQVKDVKKATVLIAKAGGTNFHEPMQVPGGSWIVKFADPQGISHAVMSADIAATQVGKKKTVATKAKVKKPAGKVAPVVATKAAKKKTAKKAVKPKATKKVKTDGKKLTKKKKKQLRKLEKKKDKKIKKDKKDKKKQKAKRKK